MSVYDRVLGKWTETVTSPDTFLCCFSRVENGHSPDCLRTRELRLTNRLAMALKRAKGMCEMRIVLGNDATTRCMGTPVTPFYTNDDRVRMLCDRCRKTQEYAAAP